MGSFYRSKNKAGMRQLWVLCNIARPVISLRAVFRTPYCFLKKAAGLASLPIDLPLRHSSSMLGMTPCS